MTMRKTVSVLYPQCLEQCCTPLALYNFLLNELNLMNPHLNYLFVLCANKNLCKLEYIGKDHVSGCEKAASCIEGNLRVYFMDLERAKTTPSPVATLSLKGPRDHNKSECYTFIYWTIGHLFIHHFLTIYCLP